MAQKSRQDMRRAIHQRIRQKVGGTGERPRLAIFRSVNHIYAQLIDDAQGVTLASASTTEKDWQGRTGGNIAAAKEIGKAIAERAKEKGIKRVVFDRGGYIYHGRVRSLAEAAREAGLEF
jgi:large subunit ribosomal protein L18